MSAPRFATDERTRPSLNPAVAAAFAVALAACAGSQQATVEDPGVVPEMPATIRVIKLLAGGVWLLTRIEKTDHGLKLRQKHNANCPT